MAVPIDHITRYHGLSSRFFQYVLARRRGADSHGTHTNGTNAGPGTAYIRDTYSRVHTHKHTQTQIKKTHNAGGADKANTKNLSYTRHPIFDRLGWYRPKRVLVSQTQARRRYRYTALSTVDSSVCDKRGGILIYCTVQLQIRQPLRHDKRSALHDHRGKRFPRLLLLEATKLPAQALVHAVRVHRRGPNELLADVLGIDRWL
jgi:hypothetical protein